MCIFHPSFWGPWMKRGESTQWPTASLKKLLQSDISAPTAGPVLGSVQLKVGGNDTREREHEERSPDPFPGKHFALTVDEKQEIVITLGA